MHMKIRKEVLIDDSASIPLGHENEVKKEVVN